MTTRLVFLTAVLVVIVGSVPNVFADDPMQAARKLMSQNDPDAAEAVLRKALKDDSENGRMRMYLARVVAYGGRLDDAVTIAEAGITEETSKEIQLNMLMLVAELRKRQADDGMFIKRRHGTVQYSPNRALEKDKVFKQAKLKLARDAYRKALAIDPAMKTAAMHVGTICKQLGDFDEAISIFEDLVNDSQNDADLLLRLAKAYKSGDRKQDYSKTLEKCISIAPSNSEAIDLLLEHAQLNGNTAAAAQWEKKKQYYSGLPAFADLPYSDENRILLQKLDDDKAVEQLFQDKSETASRLLAVYCWRHPHNRVEEQAFVELGTRKAAGELLWNLLTKANSTCTIRQASRQLALRKDDRLFDQIIRLLPTDRRTGHPIEVANALDILQDIRAVGPLIDVLDPESRPNQGEEDRGDRLRFLQDDQAARQRAAMALGGFDTEDARTALENAIADPRIAGTCAAALYRMTGDVKYLNALEYFVQADPKRSAFIVFELAEKLPDDQAVIKMKNFVTAEFEKNKDN